MSITHQTKHAVTTTHQTKTSVAVTHQTKSGGGGTPIYAGNPIGLLLALTYAAGHSDPSVIFTHQNKTYA